ncbi:lytic transglycosylase domain-containing protein [Alteribacter natronophilus]|uniref:lytic transglycosylase domain-containing protein n=1 Tax=Alteribacter natronophilus TaxID=2583810 RepID=UPI00110ED25F|nr:transglycosylase SLT domain-containing protein [Alteribacter natronophilus]TMW73830.1 lytic transglycosylase domain-containing protein [Alteribacter natronophilus]
MKRNQLKYITGAALLTLAVVSVTLTLQNMKLKEQTAELEQAKKEQKQEQLLEEKSESMKEYIDHLPEGYEVAGYDAWQEAEKAAEHMYEDSDGRFEEEWAMFLALEAQKKDIDPFLVYELIRVETGDTFDPETVGPETQYGHAYGLAQFMKNTGPWIADMADLSYEDELLFDPYYSIQLSVVYLDFLYSRYGDWDQALTAYHRGIYGMENYVEENGDARSWYAVEIQENAENTGNMTAYR